MENNTASYQTLITQLITKQSSILGPDITMAKVKHVPGITVDSSGQVTAIQGDPAEVLKQLINQFVELSGLIVKQTMESIVAMGSASGGVTAAEMMHAAHTGGLSAPAAVPAGPQGYSPEMVATINSALNELNLGKI